MSQTPDAKILSPKAPTPTGDPGIAALDRTPLRAGIVYGLGTILLLVNAYFGTYAYVVVQALLWTQTSLQRGPVVILFALALVNLGALKVGRRFAISRAEMVSLYAMLCAGTCAAGYGFVQILINQMAAPFYADYATGASKFQDFLWPHVPTWLAPQNPDVLNGFFRGNSSLWSAQNISVWATPVLVWSAFIIAIFWTLLCAMTLLRKQWVDEERLTFPLVLLPLELAENRPAFWKNRAMWAGFLLAGILESVNFLNFLYPSVPSLPIKPGMGFNEIGPLFTTRPFNTVGRFTLSFYPFAIGIGYLLSLDVSFSCWFLYLASKAAVIVSAAMGISDSGNAGPANRAPFIREQSVGAFIGIALFSAWMARKALAKAVAEVRTPTGFDRDEVMSYRAALIGGGLGLLFLTAFLFTIGLSLFQAALFVLVYVCFAITLARIVSEAGAGWAWAPGWGPGQFVADMGGANHLSGKQATMLLAYTPWMNDMRDNPMPHQAEAMRLSSGAQFSARMLLKPLIFATVVGVLAAFWAHLDIYYTYGAATAKVRPALQSGATAPARQAVSMMVSPTLQDFAGMGGTGAGALIAVGLSILRQRFANFPLHPLGYALGTTTSMEYMWCPFLIAWGAKTITLRYGGIAAYRKALPFFLGLILGDYVVPTLWGIFGMLSGYQQYMVFPH